MRSTIASVGALLIAAGVLFVGTGLQGTLLAVRANNEGFALTLIGLMTSAYFAGFVAGCQLTPRMVKSVGHIRTFTALASVASAVALAHVLLIDAYVWMVLRAASGFCFAGLAMVVEAWINERATNANRGRVLAVYRVVDLGSLTIGQVLLSSADPGSFVLFALVSILVSISLVPVALTTSPVPSPIESAKVDLRRTYRISPLAAVGTFFVGFVSAAFWAVGPVYVQNLGYPLSMVSAWMSVVIVTGAVAQWPVGAISDHFDRRKLLLLIALLSGGAGFLMLRMAGQSAFWLLLGGAVYGAFAMSLWGLFVAQANDHAGPDEFVSLNAGLLLLYGLGSVIGPLLSSQVMQYFGNSALFAYTMTVHGLIALYILWRMTQREAAEEQEEFVAVPTTSPMVFELDPRGEE